MEHKEFMQKIQEIIVRLEAEYIKIQVGTASTAMVDSISVYVPSYGMRQPVSSLGNVSILDATTIKVEAWDKTVLPAVEKAVYEAELGLQPVNHGEFVLITVPPLTKERRKEIAKHIASMGEQAKVAIRTIRQERLKTIKHEFEEKIISEDEKFNLEATVNEEIKKANNRIDDLTEAKAQSVQSM